uniref:pleckstrin homology domain-containing family O member 2-like n=1 Tax=Pristiophorus japonicus TaxID=55135 RepID=UPI00398F8CB7
MEYKYLIKTNICTCGFLNTLSPDAVIHGKLNPKLLADSQFVSDLKFQINDAEEKDSWLSALNEAIRESNNKEFDQVTVDENNSLDHLTRNRVKVNHPRRPPTRHHRKEVVTAASGGMQRLELGGQTLIIEDSTSEEQSKDKVINLTNKKRPVLMPKIKPSNVKGNDGSELSVSQSEEGEESLDKVDEESVINEAKETPTKEGEESLVKEGEESLVKEGEESLVKEGEESVDEEGEESVDEGEDLSCATETVSNSLENEGESDLQTKASSDANEMEKQPTETNSSVNRSNLPRVKCTSLGDILSESKQKVMRKQFDTYYVNLKNENVEKMEDEIALELKVTEELLQQVSEIWSPGNVAGGEQHPLSNVTQANWSTRSAAHLLNEAMAKWSEADKVLQELKGLKELCTKSKTLTLEERERRKDLLTVYRRSVP